MIIFVSGTASGVQNKNIQIGMRMPFGLVDARISIGDLG